MLKNCVLNSSVDTKKWLINAGIRAVKTWAETMLGFLIVGLSMSEIDWVHALSVSAVATIASLLISINGIPEVEAKE